MALIAAVPAWFLGSMWLGPVYSSVQTVSGIAYRALAAAVILFVVNIIGFGLGPVSVGILSDVLQDLAADQSIGIAGAIVVAISGTWGGLHFLAAIRYVTEDSRVPERGD